MNIFMYWENPPGKIKPPYLDMCYRTIDRHKGCFNLVLLDDNKISKYLKLPACYKSMTIVERADWMRIELLKEYGGLWLDSDTIILKSLTPVYKLLRNHDFVSFGPPHNPQTGVILSKKGSAVITEWNRRTKPYIGKKGLLWGTYGPIMLGAMKREGRFSRSEWGHVPEKLCYPVSHQNVINFLKCIEVDKVITKETYMVMLFNRKLYKRLVDKSEHSIIKSGNLLSQLYRRAMG